MVRGIVGAAETLDKTELHQAIVSRVKLLAELDIAERRRTQDGRIRVRVESRELDLRVSTVPTMFGESVVLRLLDRGGRPVALRSSACRPSRPPTWGASLLDHTGCSSSRAHRQRQDDEALRLPRPA